MKKVAVILCGCGSLDGSEIHEATFTLLAIDELDSEYKCFGLDKPQGRVMNFLSGTEEPAEIRNQLKEGARIARGKIKAITELNIEEFDALVLPGGFGAAFNLCSFAKEGSKASVQSEIIKVVKAFYQAKKPIGAICVAPAIISLVLGKEAQPTLTAGNEDNEAGKEFEKLGVKVVSCAPTECVIDTKNKIVSTPAYMNAKRISEVRIGIQKLIEAVLQMA